MQLREIERQVYEQDKTKDEQIKILRQNRTKLLEEIHSKQQLLDKINFMIYELKAYK